ncbi:MAG TPA: GNAT family protein [Candidatus Acidoferrales bacterium]|nr:GNAT family protein [Candidatus Acidoferrales bacterium]
MKLKDGTDVTLRAYGGGDVTELGTFLHTLPRHDLLFFRQDVADEDVLRGWLDVKSRETIATVALLDGKIVGFAYVQRHNVPWTWHVGNIVAVVDPKLRNAGLGTQLLRAAIDNALVLGLEKLAARILIEDRESVRVFEKLGFRHEGTLLDHAKDADGTLYDLAAMGLCLREWQP